MDEKKPKILALYYYTSKDARALQQEKKELSKVNKK
jgi:hypothetical protein